MFFKKFLDIARTCAGPSLGLVDIVLFLLQSMLVFSTFYKLSQAHRMVYSAVGVDAFRDAVVTPAVSSEQTDLTGVGGSFSVDPYSPEHFQAPSSAMYNLSPSPIASQTSHGYEEAKANSGDIETAPPTPS